MNRGLMVTLAVVLVAVAWLQGQGDDDGLSVARRPAGGRSAAQADGGERGTAARARTAEAPRAQAGEGAATWADQALMQSVQAWQERQAAARTTLQLPATAWAPAMPPAPPVLRAPPAATAMVVAPPAPTAPRFPHAWVGRFNDGAVVSGADATWVVHPGDVIEGQWRVERLDGRRMSLTYLPLNLPQQVVMR